MSRKPRLLLLASLALSLTFFLRLPVLAVEDEAWVKEWEAFDYAHKKVELEKLEGMSLEDLKIMRGIIFGRHGRVFKDTEIRNYLASRPWFRPDPNFQNSLLNETERQNLDIIREAEANKHEFIEPGDLRFWRDRRIEPAQLGEHTGGEWRVLAAEIEAIHGRRFDDEPWLQKYFEERYWYEPRAGYDPKQLSEIEQQNRQTILAAHKKQRRLALSPGDMELFQDHQLTVEMLSGLSLHELRLLRNEVYARHGMRFGVPWLSQYFFFQPWYEPVEEGKKPSELSAIEKRNVETIVAYERKLHDELATMPVSASLLEGMFREDARKLRNEIYARHGKIFREKELRNYFSTLDWYRPDPAYSDRSLSRLERSNAAAILAYERKADSVNDAIEG